MSQESLESQPLHWGSVWLHRSGGNQWWPAWLEVSKGKQWWASGCSFTYGLTVCPAFILGFRNFSTSQTSSIVFEGISTQRWRNVSAPIALNIGLSPHFRQSLALSFILALSFSLIFSLSLALSLRLAHGGIFFMSLGPAWALSWACVLGIFELSLRSNLEFKPGLGLSFIRDSAGCWPLKY